MGEYLYRFGIYLLSVGLRLHSLFSEKSRKFLNGRRNLFAELDARFSSVNDPVIWFHCASLGEFEQGRPLIEEFKKHYPNHFILLTFFSPSGFEVRKNYELADHVCYMPLDTIENAAKFVQITKPKMAFFIKYEFWYYHLKALSEANCWVYSVSAIFRSKQAFFKPYGKFNRSILDQIDHIFVQNKKSAALLKGINFHNVSVTGDTRFDRVKHIAENVKQVPVFSNFSKDSQVLIGGSTWDPDIRAIAPFLQNNPSWKAIIAPHNIGEENLRKHETILNIPSIRYSKISTDESVKERVIIIDNIGMLTSLYQYGDIAFIGGAFGDGLHNTLEAACFGLPVFFGNKNYTKFQEALDLLDEGAAFKVSNSDEFIEIFKSKGFDIENASKKAEQYVNQNVGATAKIMNHIHPIMDKMEKEK